MCAVPCAALCPIRTLSEESSRCAVGRAYWQVSMRYMLSAAFRMLHVAHCVLQAACRLLCFYMLQLSTTCYILLPVSCFLLLVDMLHAKILSSENEVTRPAAIAVASRPMMFVLFISTHLGLVRVRRQLVPCLV